MTEEQLNRLVQRATEALNDFAAVSVLVDGVASPIATAGLSINSIHGILVIARPDDEGFVEVNMDRVIGLMIGKRDG